MKTFFHEMSRYFCMKCIFSYLFRYSVGEPLAVNCTAEESKPPVNLTWYINQEPVGLTVK
jgi:hypothetical protein